MPTSRLLIHAVSDLLKHNQKGSGCTRFFIILAVGFVAWRNKPLKGGDDRVSAASADDLLKRRIVLLDEEVNDETAKWIIAKMLFLEYQDAEAPIYLYVESSGGNVVAGLAIIDTLKKSGRPS